MLTYKKEEDEKQFARRRTSFDAQYYVDLLKQLIDRLYWVRPEYWKTGRKINALSSTILNQLGSLPLYCFSQALFADETNDSHQFKKFKNQL